MHLENYFIRTTMIPLGYLNSSPEKYSRWISSFGGPSHSRNENSVANTRKVVRRGCRSRRSSATLFAERLRHSTRFACFFYSCSFLFIFYIIEHGNVFLLSRRLSHSMLSSIASFLYIRIDK